MSEEKKDVVTIVDGVKYTACYYGGPKELVQQEHTNKNRYIRVKKEVSAGPINKDINDIIDVLDE